jgi:hypothetical protein
MLDEIGAEDLVPPVEDVGGLKEEALVAIVVHEGGLPTGVSFSVGAAQLSYRPRSIRPGVEIACRG